MAVNVRFYRDAWWVFINHDSKRKSIRVGDSKAAAETLQAKITLRLQEGDVSVMEEKTASNQPKTLRVLRRGMA